MYTFLLATARPHYQFPYNKVVQVSRKPNIESSELTLQSLRAKFMNSVDWLKKVPHDIRDGVLCDFDKVRKAVFFAP